MPTYKNTAIVIKKLLDEEAHSEILRFMDDFLQFTPLASDRHEPDSPRKFNRRYGHNIPFFTDIHYQLADFASDVFRERVKPSYCFLSMYENGGQCPLHIDRPQCRYTIDYLIRQESNDPWEIKVGQAMSDSARDEITEGHPIDEEERQLIIDSTKWTSASLEPNDAVCYSGTNSWHYRPDKSSGKVDLVFWHFVPENFNGPLN